jgi:hypothetical protein
MFGSDILDLAIGVVFLFLLLSLICTAINELIEGFVKRRARDLERGLKELLQDPDTVKALYNHPLVYALFEGKYPPADKRKLPTYIPSRNFALALMDIVQPAAGNVSSGAAGGAGLRTALAAPPESFSKKALLALVDAAGTDAAAARQNIEDWYNAAMDRVSGWYKRRTQFILFGIGIILVAASNADAIGFTRYLSTNAAARQLIVNQAQQFAAIKPAGQTGNPAPSATPGQITGTSPEALLDSLGWLQAHGGIPFGWRLPPSSDDRKQSGQVLADYDDDWRRVPGDGSQWLLKIAGLLVSACAITLGAPFWFDLLNRFMVVRSTIKPAEKSQAEPSKS